jgi:hypothetical protein
MKNPTREEIERIRSLITRSEPAMITGLDFLAFNYGDSEFAGGRPSIVTSPHGHAYIDRTNGKWTFGQLPNIPMREASHFAHENIKIDLWFRNLEEVFNI